MPPGESAEGKPDPLAAFSSGEPGIRYAGPTTSLAAPPGHSTYRSGRSPDWLKTKNPTCEAVRREAEEDCGR